MFLSISFENILENIVDQNPLLNNQFKEKAIEGITKVLEEIIDDKNLNIEEKKEKFKKVAKTFIDNGYVLPKLGKLLLFSLIAESTIGYNTINTFKRSGNENISNSTTFYFNSGENEYISNPIIDFPINNPTNLYNPLSSSYIATNVYNPYSHVPYSMDAYTLDKSFHTKSYDDYIHNQEKIKAINNYNIKFENLLNKYTYSKIYHDVNNNIKHFYELNKYIIHDLNPNIKTYEDFKFHSYWKKYSRYKIRRF